MKNVSSNLFLTVGIKNLLVSGRNRFGQPIKIYLRLYDNIRKIATGQGGDYTTECLIDYSCFKKYFKLIAEDLSK